MSVIKGYSEFLSSLEAHKDLQLGLLVDTNIVIAATYDFDPAHEKTSEFLDLVAEMEVPLFCNVTVRSEFLEIHRRIIFTEALLDFEHQVDKKKLPADLLGKINSLRSRNEKALKGKRILRLSEAEIKDLKLRLSQVQDRNRDLWTALCEDRIKGKLSAAWSLAEDGLGLNALQPSNEDHKKYFRSRPDWDQTMKLIEAYGLSSSDAMILNIFLQSEFGFINPHPLSVGRYGLRLQCLGTKWIDSCGELCWSGIWMHL